MILISLTKITSWIWNVLLFTGQWIIMWFSQEYFFDEWICSALSQSFPPRPAKYGNLLFSHFFVVVLFKRQMVGSKINHTLKRMLKQVLFLMFKSKVSYVLYSLNFIASNLLILKEDKKILHEQALGNQWFCVWFISLLYSIPLKPIIIRSYYLCIGSFVLDGCCGHTEFCIFSPFSSFLPNQNI